MAGRGGAARPNGPAAGNKICQFKLVLLGESAVGKSSLVLRFVKGQFHEYQESTIGGEWTQGRRKLPAQKDYTQLGRGSTVPHLGPETNSHSWSPGLSPKKLLVRISWEPN